MPLSRSWQVPETATETNGVTITHTALAGGPGFILNADAISVPNLVTAPASSASVFAPASYTAQTASVATVVQNTLGYDAQFTAYFQGAASVATFQVGVGPTSPPVASTVATSISSTTTGLFPFSAYVPAGYYFSFQASQANAASVPSAALTILATPV